MPAMIPLVRLAIMLATMLAIGAAGAVPVQAATDVAVAPFDALAADEKTAALEARFAAAAATVPDVAVVPDRKVRRAVKERPTLQVCDGAPQCLAELGREVGAAWVVSGEIGGLGNIQVVYLKLTNVAEARVIRAVTVELSGQDDDARLRAAAFQLIAPDRHLGTLEVKTDVAGAAVFVDGKQMATAPSAPIPLSVGTHALRVSHPEYRDVVRFVDIQFDQTTTLRADLKALASVTTDMSATGGQGKSGPGKPDELPPPWYRRWYTVAGAGAVVFLGSAVVFGMLRDNINADTEVTLPAPSL